MTPSHEIEERIRNAMTNDEAAPAAGQWDRVLARRHAGERVVLPLESTRSRRRWLGIAAIAAGLVLTVPLLDREPTPETTPPPVASRGPTASDDNFFLPAALLAQTSSSPEYPTIGFRSPARGQWHLGQVIDGQAQEQFRYSLRPSEYESRPAWLMIDGHLQRDRQWGGPDSMWVSIDSMHPIYRVALVQNARVEQIFRDNEVITGTTRNGYTSWSVSLLKDSTQKFGMMGDPWRIPEMAIRLQAMQLSADWKGSIPLPSSSFEHGRATLWLNLVVDGQEEIVVPAGRFTCWRIRTTFGNKPVEQYNPEHPQPGFYFWLSQDRQWLVQLRYVFPRDYVESLVLLSGEEK